MKKRNIIIAAVAAIVLIATIIVSCYFTREKYEKYSESMLDVFDTVITLVAYTKDEAEFERYFNYAYERLHELHKLFNFYNTYDGMNNILTINQNAGKYPLVVEQEIIDLLKFSKELYDETSGRTNIAMGSVLSIWHNYRDDGINDPDNAKLPDMDELRAASLHTDIDSIIIDEEQKTVFLADPLMSLDVGAVAKGYATELVARELIELGMNSGILSSGGNIRAVGKPMDGIRERWGVGIQNPDKSVFVETDADLLDVVFVNDAAVASSGDYQRYYYVGDTKLHHLIDPDTLMPGNYYRAVTVLTGDAGLADYMSTALFLLPLKESKQLANSMGNVEAFWVLPDGKLDATDGILKRLRSRGASGADKE